MCQYLLLTLQQGGRRLLAVKICHVLLLTLRQGDARLLAGARSVTLSADGAHVFVAAYSDYTVSEFRRDTVLGTLSFVDSLQEGEKVIRGPASLKRDGAFRDSETPSSARAATHFTINHDNLLAIAQGDQGVSVYAWHKDSQSFKHVQNLHEPNAVDVAYARVDNSAWDMPLHMLVVVNGESQSYARSAMYRWENGSMVRSADLKNDADLDGNLRYGAGATSFQVSWHSCLSLVCRVLPIPAVLPAWQLCLVFGECPSLPVGFMKLFCRGISGLICVSVCQQDIRELHSFVFFILNVFPALS